jgi:hypothetical protein
MYFFSHVMREIEMLCKGEGEGGYKKTFLDAVKVPFVFFIAELFVFPSTSTSVCIPAALTNSPADLH